MTTTSTPTTTAPSSGAQSYETLEELVTKRRVIVTVGAGGVGKTTTAAALSVAAAQRGRRVLCLTIDPAKRLAESLGIERMSAEAHDVDPSRFAAAGVPLTGSLTAMMLDTKRTFDELVAKYSSSKAKADSLLNNKLYQYMSTSLAGTQEYMAMEKLVAVKDDPRYDLILLDTPPTANALDFLDAPERMIDALDSAAMKWFIEAFQSTGKLSLNLIARSASVVLKTVGRITGGGFLEAMAGLITELNDLFGGFKQRAAMVQKTLRGPDIAFVLVASPAPTSLKEALYFSERLEEHAMPRGAFVVNRFRLPPAFADDAVSSMAAKAAIDARGLKLDDDAGERIAHAHADQVKLATLDAFFVRSVSEHARARMPVVRVPELASDVHDIRLLAKVAELLMSGGV